MIGRATSDAQRPQLVDELEKALSDLKPDEQRAVAELVTRAKIDLRRRRMPIDELSLIREPLKLDLTRDDLSAFIDIATAKAPPPIKKYLDRPHVALPEKRRPLDYSLSQVLAGRASRRDYSGAPISLSEVGTLLHAAYGVRSRIIAYNRRGFPTRYAPNSGGLQSVEVYFVANAVEGLPQGLYHYEADDHRLSNVDTGNLRRKVVECCVQQDWIEAASAVLMLTCDMNKVFWKYGRRAYRMVHIDAGIVAENLHLVCGALRLRSCLVAGFVDDAMNELLRIDGRQEFVTLLMAVGRKPWESKAPADEPGPSPRAASAVLAEDGPDGE